MNSAKARARGIVFGALTALWGLLFLANSLPDPKAEVSMIASGVALLAVASTALVACALIVGITHQVVAAR